MTKSAHSYVMPVSAHLAELKRRLQVCATAFILAFIVCYIFSADIYSFLVRPLLEIYQQQGLERRMIFTDLTEAFFTNVKVSMMAAFVMSFPVFAGQLYFFIAPGLFKNERRVVLPYLFVAPILFLIGAGLVYYYVMPLAWKFFISFETKNAMTYGMPIALEAKISEYLSLVISLIMAFGIAFQLPIILVLMSQVGFLNADFLSKGRRYAIVLIFLVAAILTPPDVISQVALAIPLLLLYEISILICRRMEKSKEIQDA